MGIALFDKTLSPFIGTSMATDALLNAATGIKKVKLQQNMVMLLLNF